MYANVIIYTSLCNNFHMHFHIHTQPLWYNTMCIIITCLTYSNCTSYSNMKHPPTLSRNSIYLPDFHFPISMLSLTGLHYFSGTLQHWWWRLLHSVELRYQDTRTPRTIPAHAAKMIFVMLFVWPTTDLGRAPGLTSWRWPSVTTRGTGGGQAASGWLPTDTPLSLHRMAV